MRIVCWLSVLALAACGGSTVGPAGSGGSGNMGAPSSGSNGSGNGDTGSGGGTSGGTSGGASGGSGGGTVSGGGSSSTALTFAVFGDARPPNENDTSGYPSQVISSIFSQAKAAGAQFVIGTGDYMFASQASAVSAQVSLFQKAESAFGGPIYLAMGNHECTGYTDSNCPNLDESPNIQAFVGKLLPSGVTRPYYRVDVDTPGGKAKFLFIAANAWSTAQEDWLKTQLADQTTYTFVVRHEPATDNTAPGVSPSESALRSSPFTIELLGHTHEYREVDSKHVISGNGGAPLTSGSSYGWLLVQQQSDGSLTVSEIDEATAQPTDTFRVSP